jgi:hypothetical protein
MSDAFEPAEGIAAIDDDGIVYAARLPDGPVFVLEGVAALIWREACTKSAEPLFHRVAEATDAEAEQVGGHVDAFIQDLIRRGLIQRSAS